MFTTCLLQSLVWNNVRRKSHSKDGESKWITWLLGHLDGEGCPAGAEPMGTAPSLHVLHQICHFTGNGLLRLPLARVTPPPVFEVLLNQLQVREAGKPQVLMRAGLWGFPCRKPGKRLAGGCPVPAQQWAWLHFISLFVP